ncbi:MAG: MgtC/SapB family protein [Alphaproteobacteria bacterium]
MDDFDTLRRLALALAIGVLIGLERGWHGRDEPEGGRVAGVRTLAIGGLLGGLAALLTETMGGTVMAVAFLAYAVILIALRLRLQADTNDVGATTTVAGLVTFALGALAMRGSMQVAAAGGVVTALLLGIKPQLHRLIERIEREELMAVLKLLMMSVVLLPVLPNQGFGPWHALNPYKLWWMVVLVTGLSFVGYVAIKVAGARRGIVLAAVAGGIVSSTAVTASLSRQAKGSAALAPLYAGGVALACATMFPRLILLVSVVHPALFEILWPPFTAAAAANFVIAAWLVRRGRAETANGVQNGHRNPFEFVLALRFGLFLAAIAVLSRALSAWLGDMGTYLLAAASGLADVDAIALTLANIGESAPPEHMVANAICLAAAVNTLVKAGLAFYLGGTGFGTRVAGALGASLAAGGAVLALT